MTTPQPDYSQTAKKAGVGTIAVLVTLVAVFCVLPVLMCGVFAVLGSINTGGR